MKTSRLSSVSPTSSSSTNNSPTSNTVGSRLFTPTKVDTSPLDFDNEKDLQKKLEEIVAEFKNKDKEWTFRLKSLQLLQRIINGNGLEIKGWNTLLRMISPSLIEQLTELRSTIVKEACQNVSLLGIRMKSRFEPFALQYTQALMRMVPVKTTIISESAHQTLKDILDNVPTKGLMQTFLDASMDQHNEQLRKRASEYIYIVLNRAILNEGMLLVSSIPALEKSIQRLLVDGASETRQIARYCFWSYVELNEKSATSLFYQFSPTTQKNLFTVQEHLVGDQLDICEKIKLSLFEEEQSQKLVEDSTDLDFDINDFKKEAPVVVNNGGVGDSSTRSKTPTSNRTSGLKNKVTPTPTTTTTTTTTSTTTNGSTSKIGGAPTTSIRSGSSLGGRMDSSLLGSSSIKKPLDASNIIRSKSSLGTTRKLIETSTVGGSGISSSSSSSSIASTSPITKTPTTMTTKTTSSSSPNLATTTQSGRYSSIGTRVITTSLSKQTSSSNLTRTLPPINKSPVSSPAPTPPAPTLTKSKSNPTSPISTSSTSQKSTTTSTTTSTNGASTPTRRISTISTNSTNSSPSSSNLTTSIKRSSTLPSNGGTPKSTTATTPTTPKALSTSTTTKTSSTPTGSTTTTKKSFITKSDTSSDETPTNNNNNIKLQKTTSSSSLSNTPNRKSVNNEIDLESLEISLNQDNSLAFNEISDEITNNLLDAKKGLSFYEKELTLDDLENNNSNNSNSNSGNNSKRSSVSSFTNSIKESTTADLEFNWLEDSVHDSLIEDDVLDFNDENNNSTFIPRNINNKNNSIKEEEEEQQLDEDDDELMF